MDYPIKKLENSLESHRYFVGKYAKMPTNEQTIYKKEYKKAKSVIPQLEKAINILKLNKNKQIWD